MTHFPACRFGELASGESDDCSDTQPQLLIQAQRHRQASTSKATPDCCIPGMECSSFRYGLGKSSEVLVWYKVEFFNLAFKRCRTIVIDNRKESSRALASPVDTKSFRSVWDVHPFSMVTSADDLDFDHLVPSMFRLTGNPSSFPDG